MKEKLISLLNYLMCSWNGIMRFLSFEVDKCPNDYCSCKM